MAKHAISFFDKSYALTSRLLVEPAFSKKGDSEYRPWSKHSKGSSRYNTLHNIVDEKKDNKEKKPSNTEEEKDIELERKKKEFVDVIMGGKKSNSNLFWANDDGKGEDQDENNTGLAPDDRSKGDTSDSDSDDDVDSDDDSVDVMKTYKSEVSDLDFLKSKVLSNKENLSDDDSSSAPSSDGSDSEDSDSDSDDESTNESNPTETTKTKEGNDINSALKSHDNNANQILTNSRLFVRNLPFSVIEEDLKEVFAKFGTILECHIPVDDSDRNKGYAFVKFSSNDDAYTAMNTLDGTPFQGRLMHVLPAKDEKHVQQDENIEGEDNMTSHKVKKELERQKNAGSETAGLNSSFVRSDAVVENLASRLGIDKGSILNVKDGLSSGNAAVRLALGETQVIEENRKFFEKHGIDMESLVSPNSKSAAEAKRSSSTILVKNLPFDTTLDELSKVFVAAGGKKPQILLPPSRTIALVEYSNNNDAKRAFRKLAYKRFKNVPLYLEWACLSKPVAIKEVENTKSNILESEQDENDNENEDIDEGESTAVYVKNLNFRTSEDALRRAFEEQVGKVRSVRIPTKTAAVKAGRGAKNNEPQKMSMGFGFVEFSSFEIAKKAVSTMKGAVIDGHEIELQISKASTSSSKSAGKKNKPSTKIIVRNVPFQATRTEILQLFGSFGQLKTVRLPKKYDGGHRGFAFVEFTGAKEALNAIKALASTHLYGRHLVLEWAEDKESEKRELSTETVQPKNKKIRFD